MIWDHSQIVARQRKLLSHKKTETTSKFRIYLEFWCESVLTFNDNKNITFIFSLFLVLKYLYK